jgi:4-methylaminobutanoate oxidase (formaldehyde-forming)
MGAAPSVEYATAVYDELVSAGSADGLVNAGYRAIESLRLEKGYRAWGSDIGPDHTPIEAGLGWAVKLRSEIDFRGRTAIATQRTDGVRKMLAGFTCDPSVVLLGRETIYREGERVGWLTSGGYGYTIAPLDRVWLRAQSIRRHRRPRVFRYLRARGRRRASAGQVSLQPFYDPTNARVKS